jgi:cellobiose phosphorylase
MTSQMFPAHVESPSGLSVQVNANGSVRRMDHGDIILNLFLGTEIEGGPANIYLRRHDAAIESIPLLGPRSPAAVRVDERGLRLDGEWKHVRFHAALVLAQSTPAWLWQVTLENTGGAAVAVDLIYAQDLALAHYGAVRMNEYYVSQYIDYTPLTHARCGSVLAVRQNLSMGGRYPWAVIGSLGHAVSFATDALQLHGLATRAGALAEGLQASALPGTRRQHEHSMAVIQDAQARLDPGARLQRGFFGWFEADHPAASSPADLTFVDQALALPEATTAFLGARDWEHVAHESIVAPAPPSDPTGSGRAEPTVRGPASADTLFSARPILASLDLNDSDIAGAFGKDLREVERDNGGVLSFFAGANRHVVLKAKELQVLRPHGHLIRSGDHLVPDEASLTSTTWMAGVVHSLVTQGHVSINRLLSTARSYLGLLRSGGQRIFVELEDGYHLLDVPSAYEMAPNGCRWLYKHRGGAIQVCSWAPVDHHALYLSIEVLAGAPCRFLIAHHVAINGDDGADAIPVHFTQDGAGVVIHPPAESDVGRRFPQGFYRIDMGEGATVERVGGDELLFVDGRSRRQPFLTVLTAKTASAQLRITGHLIQVADLPAAGRTLRYAAEQDAAARFWNGFLGPLVLHPASRGDAAAGAERLQEIAPWFAHNAMIHYLAPRGLEQYSGGGWGTRDVCQGPVELLLALGTWAPLRDLLLRVFRTQNPDGDWPQWFMFFERERGIRPSDSHGDIIFWPLLALAQYIIATDDVSLLDEVVPFFHPQGDEQAEQATIWAHIERALSGIAGRLIPETSLVAYGLGDWNDSLQPADPAMRERLCSSWTVTLHYQTLTTLAAALRRAGRAAHAKGLEEIALRVRDDFQRLLIADATLAGFAHFQADGSVEYLLHPRDQATGIHYRLLPMIHAIINGLLTPEQAATHVGYIRQHLIAADGARLFDRPPPYAGGPQRYFQRAESSTFFGREIGIMYTHAHLRYAEAMARYGDADALFLALRQANPCDVRTVVSAARLRQANCYYSSSDALFADRYEALSAYEKVKTGEIAFEGGWRVYSSGAGIAVRLIHECLLGIRKTASVLVVDPVIPKALDGLCADVELAGKPVQVAYRVAASGCGPTALTLNGIALPFEREPNPYRTGGAAVSMAALRRLLTAAANTLEVQLQ